MSAARPVIAVVPFGARGHEQRTAAIARQLTRRLVDRFTDDPGVELRPVFLVAMPETRADAGYLVFGSTPDVAQAAGYGRTLGATYALTGVLKDESGDRALSATLVDVAAGSAVAERTIPVAAGTLQDLEREVARWLRAELALPAASDVAAPAANEAAYAALLEGLDEEVNATLLASGDVAGERAARDRAFERFVAALRADPASQQAEERLLVLAAESLERGDEPRAARALEGATEVAPRSWRLHYLLGQVRLQLGEANGAIVALEHANALHPLRDEDLVTLAELYVASDAGGQAAAHLRRVGPASGAYARGQELLGLIAMGGGDLAKAREHLQRAASLGRDTARLEIARLEISFGERDEAERTLSTLVTASSPPEIGARARRLRLGLLRADLEADLERAGRMALSAQGNLDDARSAFERVLAFDSDIWEAHFGLGLVARKSEDHQTAARAFRRVLELMPEQPDALHELGVALTALGAEADALRALEQAALLRPRDPGYLADAGFAHLRAGDLGAARERLRLASALDADDPLTRAYIEELERAEAASAKPN